MGSQRCLQHHSAPSSVLPQNNNYPVKYQYMKLRLHDWSKVTYLLWQSQGLTLDLPDPSDCNSVLVPICPYKSIFWAAGWWFSKPSLWEFHLFWMENKIAARNASHWNWWKMKMLGKINKNEMKIFIFLNNILISQLKYGLRSLCSLEWIYRKNAWQLALSANWNESLLHPKQKFFFLSILKHVC